MRVNHIEHRGGLLLCLIIPTTCAAPDFKRDVPSSTWPSEHFIWCLYVCCGHQSCCWDWVKCLVQVTNNNVLLDSWWCASWCTNSITYHVVVTKVVAGIELNVLCKSQIIMYFLIAGDVLLDVQIVLLTLTIWKGIINSGPCSPWVFKVWKRGLPENIKLAMCFLMSANVGPLLTYK